MAASQEVFDLVDENVGIAREEQLVFAGKFDVLRVGDVLSEIPSGSDPNEAVACTM